MYQHHKHTNSENLTGLARLVRANIIPAMEDVVLWHERDISHSSVERVIFPDSTILIDFMLNRLNNILKNLVVKKENMRKNADKIINITQECVHISF